MKKIHLSPLAGKPLIEYLKQKGFAIYFTQPLTSVAEPVAYHPDLILCKLGIEDKAPVFRGDASKLGSSYPADIPYISPLGSVMTIEFPADAIIWTEGTMRRRVLPAPVVPVMNTWSSGGVHHTFPSLPTSRTIPAFSHSSALESTCVSFDLKPFMV